MTEAQVVRSRRRSGCLQRALAGRKAYAFSFLLVLLALTFTFSPGLRGGTRWREGSGKGNLLAVPRFSSINSWGHSASILSFCAMVYRLLPVVLLKNQGDIVQVLGRTTPGSSSRSIREGNSSAGSTARTPVGARTRWARSASHLRTSRRLTCCRSSASTKRCTGSAGPTPSPTTGPPPF